MKQLSDSDIPTSANITDDNIVQEVISERDIEIDDTMPATRKMIRIQQWLVFFQLKSTAIKTNWKSFRDLLFLQWKHLHGTKSSQ